MLLRRCIQAACLTAAVLGDVVGRTSPRNSYECGPANGYKCPKAARCCSKWGFCGNTDHCAPGICVAGCPGGNSARATVQTPFGSIPDDMIIPFEMLDNTFNGTVVSGCIDPRHAALTFDDGIDAATSGNLASILKGKNAPAFFFVLGFKLDEHCNGVHGVANWQCHENRKAMAKIHSMGFEIGVHSYDHTPYPWLPDDAIQRQTNSTQAIIAGMTGKKARFFRAPEGKLSPRVIRILKKLDYVIVHWSHDTNDWRYQSYDPEHAFRYIRDDLQRAGQLSRGPIILQHDIYQATVDYQARIVDAIRAKGYTIVPLSTCIGEKAYTEDVIRVTDSKKPTKEKIVHPYELPPCNAFQRMKRFCCQALNLQQEWCQLMCI